MLAFFIRKWLSMTWYTTVVASPGDANV